MKGTAIRRICPGDATEIDHAFGHDMGWYIRKEGPFPQLQADGIGHIAAQVCKQIGCGFSSLAATRNWLKTDMANAFMRAYKKIRILMNETPASEIDGMCQAATSFGHVA